VQFLDDEIARLKKEISKLTQERTLLAGSALESHAYTGRTSENEMLQAVFSAISGIAKWNLPEFLYPEQRSMLPLCRGFYKAGRDQQVKREL
jgi:hypothetical protein